MMLLSLICAPLLVAFGMAVPTPRRTASISAKDIIRIAPSTASCSGAAFSDECRTAAQAAGPISHSFSTFGIRCFGTQAALLALMLYESGNFAYAQNHFPAPGRPGQGTRNMQMVDFNVQYAYWIAAHGNDPTITTESVAQANNQGPAALLDLINTDRWSFASAAWFLASKCDMSIRHGLASQTEVGWNIYLTECVGTTVNEERTALWRSALALQQW